MRTKIITVLLAITAALPAAAQDSGARKMTKKEKKILQARIDSTLHAEAEKAVNDTAFTLEADQVMFKRGYTAHVSSNTNFVSVKGGNAIIQVAFNIPLSGFNGLGGITLEGNMSNFERSKDKKGNIYVKMGVTGKGISAQVLITLWRGKNEATVAIQPNFNSNKLTLSGIILPLEKSNVFKGVTF